MGIWQAIFPLILKTSTITTWTRKLYLFRSWSTTKRRWLRPFTRAFRISELTASRILSLLKDGQLLVWTSRTDAEWIKHPQLSQPLEDCSISHLYTKHSWIMAMTKQLRIFTLKMKTSTALLLEELLRVSLESSLTTKSKWLSHLSRLKTTEESNGDIKLINTNSFLY